ncbi:hypothetical protein LIER_18290 [Lithospermum erythrorhizon]|uniref:Uncharacterized protein n=1 Tax=Lithospermum erythrorhizon TaxID=34254 RepID=A0AAV3QDF3_LITER
MVVLDPSNIDNDVIEASRGRHLEAEPNISVSKKRKGAVTKKTSGKTATLAADDEGASKKKGARVSQTLDRFSKVMRTSTVASWHLRHICEHYRIETGVKTRIPIIVETIDTPIVNPAANKRDPIERGLSFYLGGAIIESVQPNLQCGSHERVAAFPYSLASEKYDVPWEARERKFQSKRRVEGKCPKWHKYWFLAKDAILDEVRTTFSTIHTTLEYEELPESIEGLKKLEDGFLETLALDIFCDPDVLVKAGL